MAASAAISVCGRRWRAIVAPAKGWYEEAMEELFGHPAYRRFVLQDVKRLPARFFARFCGARLARAA
jgi:hypothetical protein